MSRPSRPVPECHLSGRPTDSNAHDCIGSRCSAFVRVPSPVDPKLRQGGCGLVGGKAEPWADTAPVGEVTGE